MKYAKQSFDRRRRHISLLPSCNAEALEGRTLLSTYTVTGLGDSAGTVTQTGPGHFNATTLRAAMNAANAHAGADTIRFGGSAKDGTINLKDQLPGATDDLTLVGPGQNRLTIRRDPAAPPAFRIVQVAFGVTADVRGLTLADGAAAPDTLFGGGGGIRNDGVLTVTGCTFSGNSGGGGGAIFNTGNGTLTVAHCTFNGNHSFDRSGGIYSDSGSLRVTDSTFADNEGGDAGGIDSTGPLFVARCTFIGNRAATAGGGIDIEGPTARVSDSTFQGNSAKFIGGGINSGAGELTLDRCTVAGNSAPEGAGIAVQEGTNALTNCTITQNNGTGTGGLLNLGTDLTVTNCTVVDNTGADAGGIGSFPESHGGTTLFNTIVSSPPGVVDVTGPVRPASAYNLVGVTDSPGLTGGANHNRTGVSRSELHLGPLADNGGPVQTIALRSGSVAIDAGSNALAVGADGKPLATDERGPGFARISGPRVDVGAFEVQQTGSVAGRVFQDLNKNGRRDPGEPGLRGWQVYVDLNGDKHPNANEPHASTDAAGRFVVTGVPVGRRSLRLVLKSGWRQTLPRGGGAHAPTIAAGQTTAGWDFGVVPVGRRSATRPGFGQRARMARRMHG